MSKKGGKGKGGKKGGGIQLILFENMFIYILNKDDDNDE